MPKTSAFRKTRILLLSAYDAGSHCRWREQLVHSQPASDDQHNSIDPQMVNLYSAIAADSVLFNSDWNRRSFLDGVDALFRRLPDGIPEGTFELLAAKSCVLPVPIDDHVFINNEGCRNPEVGECLWSNGRELRPCSSRLRIVWAARWEYDKGPDRLLAILQELDRRAVNYQVCILGESFRKVPEALVTIFRLRLPTQRH
ncbi:tRNA-queuosine alpha-mannosyltransferase domain-containing protein [Marinobacter sp.]|uniref:tRNA-queuosine alpha-mannosyltransferase domain-containing protein n=1 Tax=Marinobacter sp. TaxID=50741 RepID=UPI003A938FC4